MQMKAAKFGWYLSTIPLPLVVSALVLLVLRSVIEGAGWLWLTSWSDAAERDDDMTSAGFYHTAVYCLIGLSFGERSTHCELLSFSCDVIIVNGEFMAFIQL